MTADKLISLLDSKKFDKDELSDLVEVPDELVHDCKAAEAASINNRGVEEQIRYLVKNGCANEVLQAINQE